MKLSAVCIHRPVLSTVMTLGLVLFGVISFTRLPVTIRPPNNVSSVPPPRRTRPHRHVLGFSVNLLTLLGFVLAIGLVVDDAIVMLENIYRRIEAGERPLSAAIKGSREIGFGVLATTMSLIAVFAAALSRATCTSSSGLFRFRSDETFVRAGDCFAAWSTSATYFSRSSYDEPVITNW